MCGGQSEWSDVEQGDRYGPDISRHNEVQADEQGENGRTIRPSEKQPGGKANAKDFESP